MVLDKLGKSATSNMFLKNVKSCYFFYCIYVLCSYCIKLLKIASTSSKKSIHRALSIRDVLPLYCCNAWPKSADAFLLRGRTPLGGGDLSGTAAEL